MLNQEQLLKIEEEVKEFFNKITFAVDIELLSQKERAVNINLTSDTPQILIGEKGQTLIEIQQLLSAILKRKITSQEPFFIDIDINDYKKKKLEYLKGTAKALADEAASTKTEKWLPSMLAYERRIIHLELAERTDVTTESIGKEPERKIVIKPNL